MSEMIKQNTDAHVRDYLQNKTKWQNRVRRDATISHATFRVADEIASRMNVETFDAWPSIDTISKSIGVSRKAVIMAIATLCEKGYLDVRKIHNKVNRYYLVFTGL